MEYAPATASVDDLEDPDPPAAKLPDTPPVANPLPLRVKPCKDVALATDKETSDAFVAEVLAELNKVVEAATLFEPVPPAAEVASFSDSLISVVM